MNLLLYRQNNKNFKIFLQTCNRPIFGQSTPVNGPNCSMKAHTTAKFGSVVHFSLDSSGCCSTFSFTSAAVTSAAAMVNFQRFGTFQWFIVIVFVALLFRRRKLNFSIFDMSSQKISLKVQLVFFFFCGSFMEIVIRFFKKTHLFSRKNLNILTQSYSNLFFESTLSENSPKIAKHFPFLMLLAGSS